MNARTQVTVSRVICFILIITGLITEAGDIRIGVMILLWGMFSAVGLMMDHSDKRGG